MPKSTAAAIVQAVDETPIAAEVIAKAIIEIADATKAMLSAGLKYETVVTLIHAHSGVAKKDIRVVLNNLVCFKETWCSR